MNIGWAILKAHSSRSVNIPRKAYHRPKHRNNALPRLPLPHVPFPSLDFASSLAHSASNRSPSAFIKGREYCNKCSQNPGNCKIWDFLHPRSTGKLGLITFNMMFMNLLNWLKSFIWWKSSEIFGKWFKEIFWKHQLPVWLCQFRTSNLNLYIQWKQSTKKLGVYEFQNVSYLQLYVIYT